MATFPYRVLYGGLGGHFTTFCWRWKCFYPSHIYKWQMRRVWSARRSKWVLSSCFAAETSTARLCAMCNCYAQFIHTVIFPNGGTEVPAHALFTTDLTRKPPRDEPFPWKGSHVPSGSSVLLPICTMPKTSQYCQTYDGNLQQLPVWAVPEQGCQCSNRNSWTENFCIRNARPIFTSTCVQTRSWESTHFTRNLHTKLWHIV